MIFKYIKITTSPIVDWEFNADSGINYYLATNQ